MKKITCFRFLDCALCAPLEMTGHPVNLSGRRKSIKRNISNYSTAMSGLVNASCKAVS